MNEDANYSHLQSQLTKQFSKGLSPNTCGSNLGSPNKFPIGAKKSSAFQFQLSFQQPNMKKISLQSQYED